MTRLYRPLLAFLGALAVTLAVGAASAAADPTLPAGFQVVTLANDFGPPGDGSIMDVSWASDGRMFAADRAGYVFVHKPGDPSSQNELVADIHDHVNDAATTDHGLLGIATDKDFATNGYLYLLYTYDDTDSGALGRKVSVLTRITVDPATNKAVGGGGTNGVTDPTETMILGTKLNTTGSGADGSCGPPSNTNDCIPSEGSSHSIGSVRVAPDGTLFVGTGDGNDYTKVDPLTFNDNNPQTYRGKIMHIDRNGHGLPGHAFCPSDTTLTDVCTKIYAMGLRNPFRYTILPEGGLAIGDVGENNYEELDVANGGEDFGWPCWEGPFQTPFQDSMGNKYSTTPYCMARYANPAATGPAPTVPASYWSHVSYPIDLSKCTNTHGNTAIGGPEYMGDQYPAGYRGTIFYGDWTCQWINHATASGNTVTGVTQFASGWKGIDLLNAPDGNLAYVDDSGVHEIVYGPGNEAPTVTAGGTTDSAPLTADFTSAASDPDGDPINYDWDFGDGTPHGTSANPTHVYSSPGPHTATVTVDDGRGMSASASATVTVDPDTSDHQPAVTVTATPTSGAAPLSVNFAASGTDPDGDTLTYAWDFGDGSPQVDSANAGHTYSSAGSYTATVTVDDGRGMSASASVPISVSAAPSPTPNVTPGPSPNPSPGHKPVPRVIQLSLIRGVAALAGRGAIQGSFSSTHSVKTLEVSLWRGRAFAKRCAWWSPRAGALRTGACEARHFIRVELHRRGSTYTWTLRLGGKLPRGSYTLVLRALPRSEALAPSAMQRKTLRVR